MRAQGGPDEADSPAFLAVPINDVLAAGLGALGACAALYARPRIGRGQLVSVTPCASSCLLQSEHLVRFVGTPASVSPGGRDFAGPGPLDRLYPAADGWVRFGCPRPPDLASLASAGLAEAGDLTVGAQVADQVVIAAIGRAVARLPVAEVARRATSAGVPAVRARQTRELTGDEQLIRHGLLTVIETDDSGIVRVGPGRWLEMPGVVSAVPGEAPSAGEHSAAILAEVGFAADADLVRWP